MLNVILLLVLLGSLHAATFSSLVADKLSSNGVVSDADYQDFVEYQAVPATSATSTLNTLWIFYRSGLFWYKLLWNSWRSSVLSDRSVHGGKRRI